MRWGAKHGMLFLTLILLSISLVIVGSGLAIQEASESPKKEETHSIPKLDEVRALLKKKSFTEAETMAREILAEVEAEYGAESLQVAQVIDVLVESLVPKKKKARNEYRASRRQAGSKQNAEELRESWMRKKTQIEDESRSLAERTLAIRERLLGPEHPEVAKSLDNFVRLLEKMLDWAGVKPLLERALVLAEKAYGPNHIEVAKILHDLGFAQRLTSDHARARENYERALEIEEKALGPEHLDVAITLKEIGALLGETEQLAESKSYLERALAIREKNNDFESEEVLDILLELSEVVYKMGAYREVITLYKRFLPIFEKILGPDHPDIAAFLHSIGSLYMDEIGDYHKARVYIERALTRDEKIFGAESEEVASTLNTLAILYRLTGDYERARMVYERGLTIFEKIHGLESPRLRLFLLNLAGLYMEMNDIEHAEACVRRTMKIRQKHYGLNAPESIPLLNIRANLLIQSGDYDKAMELQQRALTILEKERGSDHRSLVNPLRTLAALFQSKGEGNKALTFIERAQTIREKSHGPEHLSMTWVLNDYALHLMWEGHEGRALKKALQAEEIARNRLRHFFKSASERQALAAVSPNARSRDICNSIVANSSAEIEGIASKVWDSVIRSRALVLDEMGIRHRTVAEIADPKISALVESLASARQHLADLMVRGPDPDAPTDEYVNLLNQAKIEKERAEQALSAASVTFREEIERGRAGLAEIKASLPPGIALVAFSHYNRYRPPPKNEGLEKEKNIEFRDHATVPSYLAFILQGLEAEPVVVPLGSAEEIEPLVFDWGQEVTRGTRTPGRSAKQAESAYRTAGEALRYKVWDPIAAHLKNARQVLVVPDGALHTVNFAALPTGFSEYLIENGPLIHYQSAERDLMLSGTSQLRGTGILAMGAPSFDETSLFASLSPEGEPEKGILAKAKSLLSFRGTRSGCGDFKSLKFAPLPATHKEIKEIVDIWKKGKERNSDVLKLMGHRASERDFKISAPGRQLLHIATHGFFLEGECPSVIVHPEKKRGSRWGGMGEPPVIAGENPLLLTGLALAGANNREAAGPEEEDGILTAEEVATLDLSGVNWVVLSACDTGLGKIRSGEGVFGLRRAFRIAGAQTLITSLWAVEDDAARKWMRTLYEKRFQKKQKTAESVRNASLEVLQERRRKNKSTHPFYWAGFVASGDWR
jgi:CHAT domain-containing protein/tetratricopeptide (TPR) repeat protein